MISMGDISKLGDQLDQILDRLGDVGLLTLYHAVLTKLAKRGVNPLPEP